jgi:hypothetical protein
VLAKKLRIHLADERTQASVAGTRQVF